ncbi:ankyrin repeat-containing [Paramyrothecium foliicola]|nr:ankyrin repeat-containing [Paramyrothecium foliicola]
MRLINRTTLELEHFLGEVPEYAILSHTWEGEEVTLQDVLHHKTESQQGWQKIVSFCDQVSEAAPTSESVVEYAWVDTCCIDKTSSAELSEAINAMFNWYRNARYCFAYLSDVECDSYGTLSENFEASRWFTRGWTLQELVAPAEVRFYDRKWTFIGTRTSLAKRISAITRIDIDVLLTGDVSSASVARRMSWAASRQTTRAEDTAYCLLGLFDVNMPMLYGEGEKAFFRLQEEILKEYDDHSIFAWDASDISPSVTTIGVLAPNPSFFRDSHDILRLPSSGQPLMSTNRGIQLEIPVIQQDLVLEKIYLGVLSCFKKGTFELSLAIPLERRDSVSLEYYSRTRSQLKSLSGVGSFKDSRIYLARRNHTQDPHKFLRAFELHYSATKFAFLGCYPGSYWIESKWRGGVMPARRNKKKTLVSDVGSRPTWTIMAFKLIDSGEPFGITVTHEPGKHGSHFHAVRLVQLPDQIEQSSSISEDISRIKDIEDRTGLMTEGLCMKDGRSVVAVNQEGQLVRNSMVSLTMELVVHPVTMGVEAGLNKI